MVRYEQLSDGSIRDRETGASIPCDPGNRHFAGYQAWLAAGNTPVPIRPSVHHVLDETDPTNPVWVEDLSAREDAEARAALEALDRKVPRGVEDLIDTLESLLAIDIRAALPAETRQILIDKAASRSKVRP